MLNLRIDVLQEIDFATIEINEFLLRISMLGLEDLVTLVRISFDPPLRSLKMLFHVFVFLLFLTQFQRT